MTFKEVFHHCIEYTESAVNSNFQILQGYF